MGGRGHLLEVYTEPKKKEIFPSSVEPTPNLEGSLKRGLFGSPLDVFLGENPEGVESEDVLKKNEDSSEVRLPCPSLFPLVWSHLS